MKECILVLVQTCCPMEQSHTRVPSLWMSATDEIVRVLSFVRLFPLIFMVCICTDEDDVSITPSLYQLTCGEGFPVTLQLTTRLCPKFLAMSDANGVTITGSVSKHRRLYTPSRS